MYKCCENRGKVRHFLEKRSLGIFFKDVLKYAGKSTMRGMHHWL